MSAMGSVSLLSGQPKEGVYVEARSETKGYYEEAATDNMGNFRLRGLLPDTTYMVKIVAKDYLGVKTLERASPESIAVMVGSEDVRDFNPKYLKLTWKNNLKFMLVLSDIMSKKKITNR
ncbi:hypothetical protein BHE74_00037328 [Ensete ventricosum]|uniref:Fibronectin type-III domain-containing protein n=1 Tax=Ensete ventricosum TaxID=4639 RepID=A0A427A3C1_ENSVE|nr:hypothetical protein B296_00036183 [Ensete ventricosum]RWW55991.1 hypothetical protein BHE74_00037328 [Ensete ventricosum]RZS13574.1 hypothetical protein BHM03_00045176 [Ensete ventricosum]